MRNYRLLFFLASLITVFSATAQTDSDGAMRVFMYTVYIYTDNNDEWGTDEHTHKLWRQEWGDASGNGTGWDQSACWGMNCGGGCQGTVNWGLDYNYYNQSTVPTQNRIYSEYWEDDWGDRCTYDTPWYADNDDDRNTWDQNYNVRTGCPYVWTYLDWQGSYWRNVHYSRFYYSSPRPDNAYANGTSGTLDLCGAQNISLTSAGKQCGSSTYYWYKDGVYIGQSTGTLTYYASTSGTYTVYTNDQSTNSIWGRDVIVNIASPPTANAGADVTNCGTTGMITAGATGSAGTVAWTWSGTAATLGSASSLTGCTINPTSSTTAGTGTLTLTISSAGCPNATSTRTVTWHVKPTGTAGSNISQCFDSTPLAAIAMTGATMNGNGQTSTGTWSTTSGTGTGTWSQNTANPAAATFTPTSESGSLTVRLRLQATSGYCNGQFNDYTRTITWSRIGGSAGSAVSQCATTNITTADASIYGAGTSVSWQWLPATGSATLNSNTSLTGCFLSGLSASGSGTLRLRIIGVAPCNDKYLDKAISWSSTPLGNAGSAISVCTGSGTPIPMTGATGGGLTGTPTWTGGAGLGTWTNGGSDPAAWTFTPNGTNPSGTFTATLDVAGISPCSGSAPTTTRTVSWSTPPTISIGSAVNSCNGSAAVTLTGAAAGGSISGFSWTVQSGGGSITGSGSNPATYSYDTPGANGTAVVRLTANANGNCTVSPYLEQTIQWGSISASSPATITSCGNVANIAMSGTATGQVDHVTWSGQTGGSWATTHATNPSAWVFDPTSTSGNFNATLTVYGAGGCVGQTTTSVTNVDWDVYPTVEAGTPIVVCTGAGVNIPMGASPNAAGQYTTVQWTTLSAAYGSGTWNNGGTNPDNWTFTPSTDEGAIVAQLQVNGNGSCTGTNVTDIRTIQWSKAPVISSIATTSNSNCNYANGAIAITATGNGPLSYSSNNGGLYQPLSTIPGLATGNYTVVVQDTVGCSTPYASNPVNVGGLTPITASSVVVTSGNLCAGGFSGVITVTGMSGGGGGPFTYALDGLGSSRTYDVTSDPMVIDSLPTGAVSLVILDQFGCESVVYPRTITSPSQININTLNVVDVVGCGSSGTGSITAAATGGFGTLEYYLNGTPNSPTTSGSFSALPGGSYEVMVQDANGCQTLAQTQINAPWTVTAGNERYKCGTSNTPLAGEIIGTLPATCTSTSTCSSGCGMPSGYCAYASSNSGDERITSVTFNGATQTSGASFYTDYSGSMFTTVDKGSTYTISVSMSVGGTYTEYFRVWIDWNRDGTFDDTGENMLIFGGSTGSSTRSLSITIPSYAVLGETRMRVGVRYNGDMSANACGTHGTYGEVEDYRINIIDVTTTTATPTYTWSVVSGPGTLPLGASSLSATANASATTDYRLTVNDGCGCVQSDDVRVNVSAATTSTSQTNVDCFGNTNGCVTLNPSSGVQPYLLFGPSSQVQVFGGSMRPFTVNNTSGTAYTNHPVKMTIPYSAGMRADFGDIRFFNSSQAKLSYWVESYTLSSSAVVWVKMPSLPTGNSTIYMTFGNVSLSSESEGDDVFQFFDDFNSYNVAKWQRGVIAATGGTDWSYYGGRLVGGNTNRYQQTVNTFSGNLINEARTYETASAGNGYTSAGFFSTTTNCLNILNHAGTNYCRNDGTWPNFTGGGAGQLNVWIREYVRANGTSAYVSRTIEGGSTYGSAYTNSGISAERIRLGSRGDNSAYDQNFTGQWDWMFVRPYISVEPTVSAGTVQISDNEFCGFGSGAYNFNIVDVAGCNNLKNVTITAPAAALTLSTAATTVNCYPPVDGTINLTVTGGTQITPAPPYFYNWTGPSGYSNNIEDLSGLGAGLYNVTVADDNACTASTSVTLSQLVPITSGYYTFTGNVSRLWEVADNWDCNVPDAASQVIIPAVPIGNRTPLIQLGVTAQCLNIQIQGGTADLLEIQSLPTPGGGVLIVNQ
ncbi:MAG: DUF2341 domain-containing protein [Flavobacteriales bacterium]|nr:DUF2341 domain-containing protein [Flavobacteriales bacterium]